MSRSRSRRRRAMARGVTSNVARVLRSIPRDGARLACAYGCHPFNRGAVIGETYYMDCPVCGANYQCHRWQWNLLPVAAEASR